MLSDIFNGQESKVKAISVFVMKISCSLVEAEIVGMRRSINMQSELYRNLF